MVQIHGNYDNFCLITTVTHPCWIESNFLEIFFKRFWHPKWQTVYACWCCVLCKGYKYPIAVFPPVWKLLQQGHMINMQIRSLTRLIFTEWYDLYSRRRFEERFISLNNAGILSRTTDEWLLVLHSMSILQPDSTAFHCVECNARLLTKQGPHWSASTASPSEEVYDWSLGDSSSKPECDWAVGDPQDVNKGQSDWLPTVTWESISVLLVKCVGAGLAVKMLLTTRLPSAGLPQEFYRNCILTSILEKQER